MNALLLLVSLILITVGVGYFRISAICHAQPEECAKRIIWSGGRTISWRALRFWGNRELLEKALKEDSVLQSKIAREMQLYGIILLALGGLTSLFWMYQFSL